MSTAPGPGPGPAAGPPAPVCPRHPERESYVRCQRCERPVCPECQRVAPVGVQCVDCVAEGARGVREARTAFGGRLHQGRPVVTLTVVALCAAAYVLQLAPASAATQLFGFRPVLAASEPWRFVTAAFLHSPSSITHILFNMYALWLTGPYLESLLGRLRFAALYLLSAVGGSVGSLVLADPADPYSWYALSVGASGAVFGLFGALVVVQRRLNQRSGQIIAIIAINGVIGFVVPGIAWEAHLGGLLTGAALAAVLAYAPRQRRVALHAAGTAAVVLVLLVLAATRVLTAG